MQTILFICSGNTCRSPMAEAIGRKWVRDEGLTDELFCASAGVSAPDGVPLSAETGRALDAIGIEHMGTAKSVSADMIRKAAVVLCMTEQHVETARELVADEPEHHGKIQRLDPTGDIDDPVGMGQKKYDALAKRFQTLIPKRLKEWLTREDRTRIGSPR